MSTKARSTQDITPTDRQASRADRWTIGLMEAPAYFAGTVEVKASDRDAAWTAANLVAVKRNHNGSKCVAQGVALAPLTRTELATVRAFLAGSGVRLRSDHATGLESVEHRAGRVYVEPVHRPRDLTDLDPDVMARAGAEMDRVRAQGGPWPSPTGYVRPVAEREADAIRCAALKVPEAFEPTGEICVWGWWGLATSPTFPDTPEGHACASRLARLHSGGRASLVLDGVTIATMHSAHSAAHGGDGWSGPFKAILRVLTPEAVAQLGPRAERIMTALRSTANLRHPDNVPDVETCWTPAELVAAQLDPRDGFKAPSLKADPPTIGDLHPELGPGHDLPMTATHERIYWRLQHEPRELWKLAAEHPEHFNMPDIPTDARKVNR